MEIRLKSLQLSHISHFNELHLTFSPRVTCIIGENGSGKSTLLRAIALALTGTTQKGIDTKHTHIQSLMKIKGEENGYRLYEQKGEIRINYILDEGKIFQNVILLESENNEIYFKDKGDYQNLINQTYFPQLVLGFPQLQGKKSYQEVPSSNKNSNVKDVLSLIYHEVDNRFEAFSAWLIKQAAIGNDKKLKGKEAVEFLIIEKIFEIVSQVTGNQVTFRTVEYESETIWVSTSDAPQGIPLSLISQGYNNVFGWIGFLVKRLAEVNPNSPDFTKEPAIVLIDEIDTYLHPKWQQTILSTLTEQFPNIQFIITTHSPLVLISLNSNESLAYEIREGAVIPIPHFYGRRVQDVFYEHYGIKERPVQEIAQKIEALDEAMFDEDAEKIKKELAELLPILGNEDPIIWDAKAYLEKLS